MFAHCLIVSRIAIQHYSFIRIQFMISNIPIKHELLYFLLIICLNKLTWLQVLLSTTNSFMFTQLHCWLGFMVYQPL